jgi:soluble lytic murein transglycosylase-like protein
VAALARRRKWIAIAVAVPVIAALAIGSFVYLHQPSSRSEALPPQKPEAPPDLEKLRDSFNAGVDAIHRNDGPAAVRSFTRFTFGPRVVEEYRLYYLSLAFQLAGNVPAARRTLTTLWHRNPRLIYADEAALNLASLHASAGAPQEAADVYDSLARLTDNPNMAAVARTQEISERVTTGDLAGAVHAARRIVVASPRAPQAADAIAFLRAVWSLKPSDALHLTAAERLERAVCLLRDNDFPDALNELTALEPGAPASLKPPIVLNRGLALFHMRRYEDAIQVLEPLSSSSYRFAIPALYHLSKSYSALSNAIDPTVFKTVTEKKKVGNVKTRVGKGKKAKTVVRPKIAITKKTLKLVDLARKAKKENYDHLATERLQDLLRLPLSQPVRVEVLNTLCVIAESKNQDEYEQQLIRDLVKIDPLSDPGLQHFWDKAWSAFVSGDLATAKTLFRFLADTYANPNVRRQADYWYARTVERQGQKEEAHAIYERLAAAPYLDVYALHSVGRGVQHQESKSNPLKKAGPDWREIADKEMPEELRLAYELTALTDMRDARLEIQKNLKPDNDRYAQALLADLYNSNGAVVLTQRAIKRAFPQIATVEQDSAPAYFIRMYYPVRYEPAIKKYSARNGLDPYLVMGLILQESSFVPTAKSAVGATGLMQLMPPTAKELARRLNVPFGQLRLDNPEVNIELGTAHLKMLVNMFNGNAMLAVASYNAGQGNILKWKRAAPAKSMDEFLESMPYAETRNYVKRVMMLRASYARIAG